MDDVSVLFSLPLLSEDHLEVFWALERSSVRDALNHSETPLHPPRTPVTIFPLFICFLCVYPHRLLGGERGKSREAARRVFLRNAFDSSEEPSLCPSAARRDAVRQRRKSDLSELGIFCALSKVVLAFSPHSSCRLCCAGQFFWPRPEDLIF